MGFLFLLFFIWSFLPFLPFVLAVDSSLRCVPAQWQYTSPEVLKITITLKSGRKWMRFECMMDTSDRYCHPEGTSKRHLIFTYQQQPYSTGKYTNPSQNPPLNCFELPIQFCFTPPESLRVPVPHTCFEAPDITYSSEVQCWGVSGWLSSDVPMKIWLLGFSLWKQLKEATPISGISLRYGYQHRQANIPNILPLGNACGRNLNNF